MRPSRPSPLRLPLSDLAGATLHRRAGLEDWLGMERSQLQQYRSDRRKLLDFILSSGLVKEVGQSSSDLDFDEISADYVLTCAKSGGVFDVLEATRRFHWEGDYPILINSRLGSSYFLFSDQKTSGSPPLRMPPDIRADPDSFNSHSVNLFDDASTYTRNCGDSKKDSSVQFGNNVTLPKLRLPSLHTGLSDDGVRETAYEVLLAVMASNGVPIYVSEGNKEKKSKHLVRRRSRTENRQNESLGPHTRFCNTVRQLMEISEAMDECTRKCLMHCYSDTKRGHVDVIQISFDLLDNISQSDFSSNKTYLQWHRRQVNLLEEIVYSSADLFKDGHSRIKAAFLNLRNNQDLAIKKASSVRNELLAPIKNFASKLSKNSAKYGVHGENYYWTSCYHLNVRMYEKLLSSVFDNLEEDQLVEEAEEVLAAIRLTWPTLGITAKIHHTLYGWVLLKQFIVTGEPRLLYFATLETQKVVVIIKNDESEEAYLDSLKCSVEDSEDLLNSSLVDTVLSSTAIWCDSLLNDYHWHFRGKPKCFKRVLSLAETVGAWTTESLGATKDLSSRARTYVEASIQAECKRVMDNLDINSEVNGGHILALLAEELQSVAERENNIFNPVLSQWFPEAVVLSSSLLHKLYREKLMPFLHGVTELSEDARSVLPAADMLDDCLAQLIMSAGPCLDKSVAEKLQSYQIGMIAGPMILKWLSAQQGNMLEWTERAFNLEEWLPLSSQQKQAVSIIEVFRIIEETIDQFFGLKLPMDIIHLHSLLFGICHSLEAYLQKLASQIEDKNQIYPTFAPLTRYKEAANPFARKKAWEHSVIDEKLQGNLRRLSTSNLCVKLNTLHYAKEQIGKVEDSMRNRWKLVKPYANQKLMNDYLVDATKQGQCKFSESADNMFSNFNHVRKISDDGIGKISDFIGAKVMYWDLRDSFLMSLYRTTVHNARLESYLEHLDDALDLICDLVMDKLRDPVVFSVCQATFEMYAWILLDGGPSRAFSVADVDMIQEDLNILKEFFVAEGEGLPQVVVEKEAKWTQQILDLYSLKAGDIIEMLMNASEQITSDSNVPKFRKRSPDNADTLLRILCHKKEKEASKFLKRHYQLPNSCDYEESGQNASIPQSPILTELVKRSASFQWNEKGRRSLRTIRKKFQEATT